MKSRLKTFNFPIPSEKDSFGLDFAPLLDLCIIAGFFVWLSSHFTFSPGIPVELPQMQKQETLQGVRCTAVLTVTEGDVLLLEGARYRLNDIGLALKALVDREQPRAVKLLLKMDKSTNMNTFLGLCEIADTSGIKSVQVASKLYKTVGN
jgi:biopolymer transport protein ExbD